MSKTDYRPPPALVHPPPALGIDIGADGLHVCAAPQPGSPDQWAVHYLDFKADPLWWMWLVQAASAAHIVCAEPTGWVYLQPVASILENYTDAQLWLVDHGITGKMRDLRISGQKTDETDARALALIALDVLTNNTPRRVRFHNPATAGDVLTLRFAVNAHRKLNAESVRLQNRLRQIGHSLFPALGASQTWRFLLSIGIVTPRQIKQLDLSTIPGRNAHFVDKIRRDLPDLPTHPHLERIALENWQRLQQVEDQIAAEAHRITQIVAVDPFAQVTHRWMTMPLAKIEWVAAFHVATDAEAVFFTQRQFKAALGAFPQLDHSGSKTDSRSSKRGYRPALNALHLWTMALTNPKVAPIPNPIHEYFAGGEKNGGRKFTAAKAKLARILWAVARSEEGYQS